MKKILVSTTIKITMLLLFTSIQVSAWASDLTSSETGSRLQQFFSMPSVWIAIAGVIVFVGLAFFTGNKSNNIKA